MSALRPAGRWWPAALRVLVCVLLALPMSASAQPTDEDRLDVAVLLPLTGPWEPLGQRALRQIRLASSEVAGVKFEYFDTGPGVESALEQALAVRPRILLGPLGEMETREAARLRPTPPVPLLSLAGTHGLEDPDAHVYRLRTSTHELSAGLAEWLVQRSREDEVAIPSAAVLAPEDGYGREAALSFVATAVRFGMQVRSVAFYPPDTRDLRPFVEELVGRRTRRLAAAGDPWRRGPRSHVRTSGRTIDRPTWIFLPDDARVVADIAPFLQFESWFSPRASSTARAAGLSAWQGTELSFAGDLLGGGIAALVFHVDDLSSEAQAYADEFRVRYGAEPLEFDAQTYDAALWAFAAARWMSAAPEAVRWSEVVHAVGRLGGACGTMWLDTDGAIRREIRIFEVDPRGGFHRVDAVDPSASSRP